MGFSQVELGVLQQKTFLSLCTYNNNNFIKPKKVIINYDKIIQLACSTSNSCPSPAPTLTLIPDPRLFYPMSMIFFKT